MVLVPFVDSSYRTCILSAFGLFSSVAMPVAGYSYVLKSSLSLYYIYMSAHGGASMPSESTRKEGRGTNLEAMQND